MLKCIKIYYLKIYYIIDIIQYINNKLWHKLKIMNI